VTATIHRLRSSLTALHIMLYVIFWRNVIQNFKDADTFELFVQRDNRRWRNIGEVALRKLDQMEAAINLTDLRVPPGNRLEPLAGNRRGRHSIRINDQFRICFAWEEDGAHDVEIVDYHPESKRRKKRGPQPAR
jgi:proteic killer suppression protein